MLVNLISFSRKETGVTLLLPLNPTLHSTLLFKNPKRSHFLLLPLRASELQISASLFADAYQLDLPSPNVTCYSFCGCARLYLEPEKSLLKQRGNLTLSYWHSPTFTQWCTSSAILNGIVCKKISICDCHMHFIVHLAGVVSVFSDEIVNSLDKTATCFRSQFHSSCISMKSQVLQLLLFIVCLREHPQALDVIGPGGLKYQVETRDLTKSGNGLAAVYKAEREIRFW